MLAKKVRVSAWAPSSRSRIGLSGGYRYNSVLGNGVSSLCSVLVARRGVW